MFLSLKVRLAPPPGHIHMFRSDDQYPPVAATAAGCHHPHTQTDTPPPKLTHPPPINGERIKKKKQKFLMLTRLLNAWNNYIIFFVTGS